MVVFNVFTHNGKFNINDVIDIMMDSDGDSDDNFDGNIDDDIEKSGINDHLHLKDPRSGIFYLGS